MIKEGFWVYGYPKGAAANIIWDRHWGPVIYGSYPVGIVWELCESVFGILEVSRKERAYRGRFHKLGASSKDHKYYNSYYGDPKKVPNPSDPKPCIGAFFESWGGGMMRQQAFGFQVYVLGKRRPGFRVWDPF